MSQPMSYHHLIAGLTKSKWIMDRFFRLSGRREYLSELARQLGLPPPSLREPHPGEAAYCRGGNKRASNRRMLNELRVELGYPTYLEGLKAVITSPAEGPR
jgi:hypothetical protein